MSGRCHDAEPEPSAAWPDVCLRADEQPLGAVFLTINADGDDDPWHGAESKAARNTLDWVLSDGPFGEMGYPHDSAIRFLCEIFHRFG
jgi:hypothetical protein